MNDDELIAMVEAGDKFWHEFSALCNRHILAAPEHLRNEYEMYLGEKTSIYGREVAE